MTTSKPAIVGAFILSGVALGIATILLFGSTHLFSPTVHAVVYFKGSVANLDVGAPVTFRGVRVGSVVGIAVSLDMTDFTAQIPVYLDLDPTQISLHKNGATKTAESFDRLLKAGLRAQLNMQSLLTGQLLVDLDILPDTPETLIGSDSGRTEIPSIPSRLQTIESEIAELPLKEMVDNANQALVAIRQMTDALAPKIGPLADSMLSDSETARSTLADIDRLAVASQHQVSVNGEALRHVLAASGQTMKDSDALLLSVKDMTAPNSPIRSDLEDSLRDLAASASSLRGFTHEIERDPSVLLSGRTNH